MEDIREKQRELMLELDEELNWDSGLKECPGVDAMAMTEMPSYVEENLKELLAKYIDDDNNYVVDGAFVKCDQMSKEPVQMYYWNGKLGIEGEGGSAEIDYKLPEYGQSLPCFEVNPNEMEIRKFHAINSAQKTCGLRFGVISDRSCLRDKIEKENGHDSKDSVSLRSLGNCKIMRAADVLEINKRKYMAKIYGTCYCLMKPDAQWVNPYCMEGLVENTEESQCCNTNEHHNTMKWSTEDGEEEGLTRLSTLLCARGGIITFSWSGQYVHDIQNKDNKYESLSNEEIMFIATIYGEGTNYSTETRQALAHAIMNRVGVREWKEYDTVEKIIQNTGFDAYNGSLYKEAKSYLENRDYSNETIESIIDTVLPIYRKEQEDTTNNVVLFYSPEAQAKLHELNPSKYKNPPGFVNDQVEEVYISGSENDDIKFFRYKD